MREEDAPAPGAGYPVIPPAPPEPTDAARTAPLAMPTAPPYGAPAGGAPVPVPPAAPPAWGAGPAQPYGLPAVPAPPYATQPYGAQAAPPYGSQPYGSSIAPPYGAQPAQPYGAQPAQPYGLPSGPPYAVQPVPGRGATQPGNPAPQSYGLPPTPVWGGQPSPVTPASSGPGHQPEQTSQRWLTAVIVGGIVVGIAVIFVLIRMLLVGPAYLFDFSSGPAPASTSDSDTTATGSGEDPATGEGSSTGSAATIGDELQAKIDEYRTARDDGSLWQKIPDNEFNRTAVTAFLYIVTDLKAATIWGVTDHQAREYTAKVADVEAKLLAQQPLGEDIHIELETRTFDYDGSTGEGGYTDN